MQQQLLDLQPGCSCMPSSFLNGLWSVVEQLQDRRESSKAAQPASGTALGTALGSSLCGGAGALPAGPKLEVLLRNGKSSVCTSARTWQRIVPRTKEKSGGRREWV